MSKKAILKYSRNETGAPQGIGLILREYTGKKLFFL
jgi:ribosomal protein S19